MPSTCTDFSHLLLGLFRTTDMDEVAVFSATIESIDRINNKATLVYTTTPLDPIKYPSLISMDVPFFYHCEFSNGTLEELSHGHLAFLEGDAVYVLHFWGSTLLETGNTYIIGHADIKDIKKCKPDILKIVLKKAEIIGSSWVYIPKFVTYFNALTETIITPIMADGSDAGFSFPVDYDNVNFIAWESEVMTLNEPIQFERVSVSRNDIVPVVDDTWTGLTYGRTGFSIEDSCSWSDTSDPPNTYYQCLYKNSGLFESWPYTTTLYFISTEEGWLRKRTSVNSLSQVQYPFPELDISDEIVSVSSLLEYYKPAIYYAKGNGDTPCEPYPKLDAYGNSTLSAPAGQLGHIKRSVRGIITDPNTDIIEDLTYTVAHAQSSKGYDAFVYNSTFIGHYRIKLRIDNLNIDEESINRKLVPPVSCSDGWTTEWTDSAYHNHDIREYHYSIYTPWSDQIAPDFEISVTTGNRFDGDINGVDTLYGNVTMDSVKDPISSYTTKTARFDLHRTGYIGTITIPSMERETNSSLPLNNASMVIGNTGIYGIVALLSFKNSATITAEYDNYQTGNLSTFEADFITEETYSLDDRVKFISCAYCPNTEVMNGSAIVLDMKNDFETTSSLVLNMESAVNDLVDYMISETYPVGILTGPDFASNSSKLWAITSNVMEHK